MNDDQNIITEYKKAINSYYKGQVIDLDKRLQVDCFLLRLEDTLHEIATQIPPFRQTSFAILYVRKGSGEKTIGNHSFSFKDRTLMIIPARTNNSTIYHGKNSGYYLTFNLKFFLQKVLPSHRIMNRRLFTQLTKPFINIDQEVDERISDIFEIVLMELEKKAKKCR